MKIELKLYASFRQYLPEEAKNNQGMFQVRDGTTIDGILEELKIPKEAVKIMFLNGIHARGDEVLQEGDRLGIFPPVAGG
jgi:molybdopterin converting factor small subunit